MAAESLALIEALFRINLTVPLSSVFTSIEPLKLPVIKYEPALVIVIFDEEYVTASEFNELKSLRFILVQSASL